MKNILVLLLAISFTACQVIETNDSKAKKLIKNYLKETLNDYDGYSSVSFSSVDSVFSKWSLPEELKPELLRLEECAKKINNSGYKNITAESDANTYLKDFKNLSDEEYRKNCSPEFLKQDEMWYKLWLEFKQHQDIIDASKKSFKPQFIGFKMTHKYRAKNQYNATILRNREFYFDKELTQITHQWAIDAD